MAVPLTITDQMTALLTTTLRRFLPTLSDQLFKATPFYAWIDAKGRKKTQNGSHEIVVPLLYGPAPSLKWYSYWDTFSVEPAEGISAAKYGWHQLIGNVPVSRREMRENSGEYRLLNLVGEKVTQLKKTLRQEMANVLFAGNTGSPAGYTAAFTDDSKQLQSLNYFIPTELAGTPTVAPTFAPATYGSPGGIDASTWTWWKSQWAACNYTGITAQIMHAAMANMYHTCADGSDTPDLILTTQEVFELYENLMIGNQRYIDTKMGELGFDNIRFYNTTMMYDKYLQATLAGDRAPMYFINSDNLWLVVDSQTDFVSTPFERLYGQDGVYSSILWMGTLVCNERRGLGVIQFHTS